MAEEGSRFEVAARRMQGIVDEHGWDIVDCHMAMDALLCEILHAEGYGTAAGIFEGGEKLYA